MLCNVFRQKLELGLKETDTLPLGWGRRGLGWGEVVEAAPSKIVLSPFGKSDYSERCATHESKLFPFIIDPFLEGT